MNCLVCNRSMLIRQGKFGPFYYCPNGRHGTISVEKYKSISCKTVNYVPPTDDPLMISIERQIMSIGGYMSDQDRFYIDNEQFDPENFWQDIRPY